MPGYRHHLLPSRFAARCGAVLTAAALALTLTGTAVASQRLIIRSYRGTAKRQELVFRLHGLDHATIRWGRISIRGHLLRLSLRRLEQAARSGVLQVRVHRRLQHRRSVRLSLAIAAPDHRAARHTDPSPAVATTAAAGFTYSSMGSLLSAVPSGAMYVNPSSGSDANPGTQSAPWKTLAHAAAAAQPGQTVVLEAGTYGAAGTRTNWTASGTATAPITFIGDPSATSRPTVLGYNVLYGSNVRVENLLFDGPTGQVDTPTSSNPTGQEVMIWADAPNISIIDCEITGSLWHAGVYLTNASDDQLIGNYIHDNGNFSDSTQANEDQGIYWGSGTGGQIIDNLIVHNYAFGIQLYPSANGVTVQNNTILANGKSGVIIDSSSSNNTIQNNAVANNGQYSIRSGSALTGTNNVVQNNLVWNNAQGNFGATTGLTLTNNTQQTGSFISSTDNELAATSPGYGTTGIYTNPLG